MRIRGVLLAVVLVTVVASCGSGEAADTPKATSTTAPAANGIDLSHEKFEDDTKENAVTINAIDNLFKAPYIEVKAGTVIVFRNDGHNEHNVLPDEKGVFADIATDDFEPGVEKQVVLTTPGDYPYYCSLHGNTKGKGMVGAIRVLQ